MKKAKELYSQALMKIDATAILYEEMSLNIRNGGEDMAQYENMTFSRQQLYDEIWSISTSRVAKKYSIPYDKLKMACKDANIPTPTQSYWSSLSIGKEVEKEPLPPSEVKEVVVQYSIKSKEIIPPQINVAKVIEEAVLQSTDLQKVELKTQPQRTSGTNWCKANAEDLFHLDLAYAPPFSTTKDPVMYTGMILENAIHGGRKLITPDELEEVIKSGQNYQLIDAREASQYEKDHLETAVNIQHAKLRDSLNKLDKEVKTVTYCNKGVTGNAAQNILLNHGFKEVYNLSGGHKSYRTYKKVTK